MKDERLGLLLLYNVVGECFGYKIIPKNLYIRPIKHHYTYDIFKDESSWRNRKWYDPCKDWRKKIIF